MTKKEFESDKTIDAGTEFLPLTFMQMKKKDNEQDFIDELKDSLVPIQKYIETKDEYGYTILHLAAAKGFVGAVNILLENGANIKAQNQDNKTLIETPIDIAIKCKRAEVLKALLEYNKTLALENQIDIKAKDEYQNTLLHHAVDTDNNVEVIQVLVDNGADIEAQNAAGYTPLRRAVSYLGFGSDNVVVLLNNKAEVNARNNRRETALHIAAYVDNTKAVEVLIEKNADINAKDNNHKTPLHHAVEGCGGENTINILLAQDDIEADARDKDNCTPFILTAVKNNEIACKTLISSSKIDINARDQYDNTALHQAISYDRENIVDILLEAKVDVNAISKTREAPLYQAVSSKNINIVKKLLGARDIKLDGLNAKSYNQTALHLAVSNNSIEIVKLLVALKEIDLDEKNYIGTALYIAVEKEYAEIVKILINAGAKSDVQHIIYGTALHLAVSKGNEKITEILASKREALDCTSYNDLKDHFDAAALHLAVGKGDAKILQILIDAGAKLDVKDRYGNTPLHIAVQKNNLKIIKILANTEKALDEKNNRDETPLHLAVSQDCKDAVKTLVDAGAKLDEQNEFVPTPLHIAVENNNVDMVKTLVDAGADINIANRSETPLYLAVKNKNEEIAKILIDKEAHLSTLSNDNYHGTVFHFAVKQGLLDVVGNLLAKKVDVNLKNHLDETPLDHVQDNQQMANLLRKHGAKTSHEKFKENDKAYILRIAKYAIPASVSFIAGSLTILLAAISTTRNFSKNILSKIFKTPVSNSLFGILSGGTTLTFFVISGICAYRANQERKRGAEKTDFTTQENGRMQDTGITK